MAKRKKTNRRSLKSDVPRLSSIGKEYLNGKFSTGEFIAACNGYIWESGYSEAQLEEIAFQFSKLPI